MAAHMKTAIVCLTAWLAPLAAGSGVIPQPVSVETQPGVFRLHAGTAIVAPPGTPEGRQVAGYLASALAAPTGWQLKVSESTYPLLRRNAIVLAGAFPAPDHPEGYELVVTPRGVRIQSPTPAGLFYGVADAAPTAASGNRKRHAPRTPPGTVPCVHIVDYPRYAWRGLMLDVSRHFFTKEFVEAVHRPHGPLQDERVPLAPDRRQRLAHRDQEPAATDPSGRVAGSAAGEVGHPRSAARGRSRDRRRVLYAGRHPRSGGVRQAALRHGGSRDRDARPFAGGAGGLSRAVLHGRPVSR